ncbi:MAG: hypothetical protein ACWA5R_04110, partial [bacterium]
MGDTMLHKAGASLIVIISILVNSVVADGLYVYQPPIPIGKRYLISQGFFGSYTHSTAINVYAVDLTMPEGSSVCAARTGKVHSFRDKASLVDAKKSNT